eukprot:SAG11_NODE_9348_length_920_cov_0.774665_2_plen_82_part_01
MGRVSKEERKSRVLKQARGSYGVPLRGWLDANDTRLLLVIFGPRVAATGHRAFVRVYSEKNTFGILQRHTGSAAEVHIDKSI